MDQLINQLLNQTYPYLYQYQPSNQLCSDFFANKTSSGISGSAVRIFHAIKFLQLTANAIYISADIIYYVIIGHKLPFIYTNRKDVINGLENGHQLFMCVVRSGTAGWYCK